MNLCLTTEGVPEAMSKPYALYSVVLVYRIGERKLLEVRLRKEADLVKGGTQRLPLPAQRAAVSDLPGAASRLGSELVYENISNVPESGFRDSAPI